MINNIESLVRVSKDNAKDAVETLVRAFQDYPLLQYYFANDPNKDKIYRYFMTFPVYSGIRYGEVYGTSNLEGIAVWIPSDNYPLSFWKVLRSVPLSAIIGFGRLGGYEIRRFGEYIDNIHKRLAPFTHWYLQSIGVDPRFQGKGYSSKLMKSMLSKFDKEHLPVYLETADEKNVPVYEHFGFRVVDKSIFSEGNLTNWAMLREAQ